MSLHRFPSGHVIASQGGRSFGLCIVFSGSVRLVRAAAARGRVDFRALEGFYERLLAVTRTDTAHSVAKNGNCEMIFDFGRPFSRLFILSLDAGLRSTAKDGSCGRFRPIIKSAGWTSSATVCPRSRWESDCVHRRRQRRRRRGAGVGASPAAWRVVAGGRASGSIDHGAARALWGPGGRARGAAEIHLHRSRGDGGEPLQCESN